MRKANFNGGVGAYESPSCRIINFKTRHTILTGSIEEIYAGALEAGKDMLDDDAFSYDF